MNWTSLLIGVLIGLIGGFTLCITLLRSSIGDEYTIRRLRAKKGGRIDVSQMNKPTDNTKEVEKGLKRLRSNLKNRKLQRKLNN